MKEHAEEGMDTPVLRDEWVSMRRTGWGTACCRGPDIPCHFWNGRKFWRKDTKFGRCHRTELEGSYFVGWHNRKFFFVLPKWRRRLYVATPTSWKEHEPGRAFAVPSSPKIAYKSNAMVDVDGAGTV